MQFVLGYTPDEFAATLGHIAEGAIPVAPLLTGRVGLGGVARAFEDLAAPIATRRSSSSRATTEPQARPQKWRDARRVPSARVAASGDAAQRARWTKVHDTDRRAPRLDLEGCGSPP